MLKTVKNGCGIRVDPPPVFSKFPHFPVFFFLGASLNHMGLLEDRSLLPASTYLVELPQR